MLGIEQGVLKQTSPCKIYILVGWNRQQISATPRTDFPGWLFNIYKLCIWKAPRRQESTLCQHLWQVARSQDAYGTETHPQSPVSEVPMSL